MFIYQHIWPTSCSLEFSSLFWTNEYFLSPPKIKELGDSRPAAVPACDEAASDHTVDLGAELTLGSNTDTAQTAQTPA